VVRWTKVENFALVVLAADFCQPEVEGLESSIGELRVPRANCDLAVPVYTASLCDPGDLVNDGAELPRLPLVLVVLLRQRNDSVQRNRVGSTAEYSAKLVFPRAGPAARPWLAGAGANHSSLGLHSRFRYVATTLLPRSRSSRVS